ncbi:hypothetical protein, partial [Picosynechococcus sp. NKBG042902]|uniref:hypothetical protein n=1 Tax=Picosynechococcus sp. NKBG042902 TaxID=490193 RepID=UPI0004AA0751
MSNNRKLLIQALWVLGFLSLPGTALASGGQAVSNRDTLEAVSSSQSVILEKETAPLLIAQSQEIIDSVIDSVSDPAGSVESELEELLNEPEGVSEDLGLDEDEPLQEVAEDDEDIEGQLEEILSQPAESDDTGEKASRPLDTSGYSPRRTAFILNGTTITHLSDWQITTAALTADATVSDIGFNAFKKLSSSLTSEINEDNIVTTDFRGNYLQLKTARTSRTVDTDLNIPVLVNGFEFQLTLAGDCGQLQPQEPAETKCNYLIPLRFSGYDERLIPTGFELYGIGFGEVIPQETFDTITEPGFFNGDTALDIDVRNTGFSEDFSRDRFTNRFEELDNVFTVGLANVRQVIKQNSEEAALGRTIRAFTFIPNDKDNDLDAVAQLATVWLPDAVPSMDASDQPASPYINRNLFRAANEARLPDDSFTWYQAGVARARHVPRIADGLEVSDVPAGIYNGLWIGLSPITKRSIEIIERPGERFENVGEPRIIDGLDLEVEGGIDENIFVEAQIPEGILDNFGIENLENFNFNNIPDVYAQIRLAVVEREAIASNVVRYSEEVNYVPHISYTGNVTEVQNRFRYYTGALFDYTGGESGQAFKPYAGLDHSFINQEKDGRTSVGVMGYFNPDRDYYSHAWFNALKMFKADEEDPNQINTSFTLASSFKYAFDQPDRFDDDTFSEARGSNWVISAAARIEDLVLGVASNIGGFLDNADENYITLNLISKLSDNVTFSAFYTPYDEGTSERVYGA